MKNITVFSFLITILFTFGGTLGCRETVSFNVLRAAKVNVPGMTPEGHEPTVAIGKWTGVDHTAANEIAQQIRELVTNAPGGIVKFSEAVGVVQLNGELREYRTTDEIQKSKSTCYRRDDKGKEYKYPCIVQSRRGKVRIAVSMNVLNAEGTIVGADTFQQEMSKYSPGSEELPPPLDWSWELDFLKTAAAKKLAQLVVPQPVVVTKPWYDCGDAQEICKGGLLQLRQGNFEIAQEQFRKAIETLNASPNRDAKALAAAWWALTLSQEFAGDYAGAKASLSEATKLDPSNADFAAEARSINEEQSNAQRLSKQGIGGEE